MTDDDYDEFSDAIEKLFLAMGAESTPMTYRAYWLGLSDLTLHQLRSAIALAVMTCRFVPKPIELREFVFGKHEDRAELAWTELQRAIPLGPYKHIDFADRVINATVRSLGGWPTFLARFTGAESEKWARADFLKTYSKLAACKLSDEAVAYLPGITEMQREPIRIEETMTRRLNND